jgi:hypothetical protein
MLAWSARDRRAAGAGRLDRCVKGGSRFVCRDASQRATAGVRRQTSSRGEGQVERSGAVQVKRRRDERLARSAAVGHSAACPELSHGGTARETG